MFGLTELIIILVFLLGGAFWVWMLAECAVKEAESGNTKLVWIIIIVFTGLAGAAVYYFIRRSRRRAELGR